MNVSVFFLVAGDASVDTDTRETVLLLGFTVWVKSIEELFWDKYDPGIGTQERRDFLRVKNLTLLNKTFRDFLCVSNANRYVSTVAVKNTRRHYLCSNFTSRTFPRALESHLCDFAYTTTLSVVLLDYLNMPGSYAIDRYFGKNFGLLVFLMGLFTNKEQAGLQLKPGGVVILPLTPRMHEAIVSSEIYRCSSSLFEVAYWGREEMMRHPLVASDVQIFNEIMKLEKDIYVSLNVLGTKGKSSDQMFMVLRKKDE